MVLAQLPNWWEAIVVMQSVMQHRAVINPVVAIYREAELRFILRQAGPKVVVTPHQFRGFDHLAMVRALVAEMPAEQRPHIVVIRPAGELAPGELSFEDLVASGERAKSVGPTEDPAQPDDIALLLYTSGTTAAPKGALHSHATLLYECRSIADTFGLGREDHVFMASPLTHITGLLYGLLLPPLIGAPCVLLDVWDEKIAVDLIEDHACRFTVSATPFLAGLNDEYRRRGQVSALRHFGCGGADVPPELVRQATQTLDANVVRIYGSTEFPTFSCGRATDSLADKAETDGYPIGPVEARLDGDSDVGGELLLRGPDLFLGYLDADLNDASFTEDGFFRTGDLAKIDERGAVTIIGRAKDIIIRKGEKISAREVEDMLYQHPAIADAAVVAVPDPSLGEMAVAAIVIRSGQPELTVAEVSAFLAGFHVAKQKHPEAVVILDELPRTSSGKIQKYLLRERFVRARAVG